MVQTSVVNQEYTYDWFVQKSKEIDRTQCTLPEDSKQIISEIKNKLNIKYTVHYEIPFEKKRPTHKKEETHDICKLLNKITKKNYNKLSPQLFEIVDYIVENDNEKSGKICKQIFDIITNNSLCSSIYAKLYYEMIQSHDIFQTLFDTNCSDYLDSFKKIKFVSPNDNYDQYCLYVKEMEKMKNFSLFLVQCVFYSICKIDDIVDILVYFQNELKETLKKEECINENEQMTDAIYLILKDSIELAMFHEKWDSIEKNMNDIHKFTGNGKNNKIKFKIMDIMDCIEKKK